MKTRFFPALFLALFLTAATGAQNANSAPASGQPPAQNTGNGQDQRGGRGGWGGGMGSGRGITGTVTEAAADHYTIKTEAGESYVIHFSANTRILKQSAERRNRESGNGGGMGAGSGSTPQTLKATDIKVGDAIAAMGEVDAAAKSVGAVVVLQIDPERAKEMREMQANYGKTWLMGKVTAIDGVKVTLFGSTDNIPHSFTADENTTFRKRRDPITLADIQIGDTVRVEGAIKSGSFLATSVSVVNMPSNGTSAAPHPTQP